MLIKIKFNIKINFIFKIISHNNYVNLIDKF